ncbi:MAG: hypothetical protein SOZ40_06165 [Ezakiella sp.]|nr:hypothetical protein [Ezakiella sp.]
MEAKLKTLERLKSVQKLYREAFGENSLDRCILCEPFPTEEEAEKLILTLQKAIDENTPLEQIDGDLWRQIIF